LLLAEFATKFAELKKLPTDRIKASMGSKLAELRLGLRQHRQLEESRGTTSNSSQSFNNAGATVTPAQATTTLAQVTTTPAQANTPPAQATTTPAQATTTPPPLPE